MITNQKRGINCRFYFLIALSFYIKNLPIRITCLLFVTICIVSADVRWKSVYTRKFVENSYVMFLKKIKQIKNLKSIEI